MTAKEYLSQIRLLDRKIDQRLEEAADLRQIAFGLKSQDYSRDRVQSSPDPDKQVEIVHRYVVLEKEINAMIDRYVELKHRIIDEIQMLPDQRMVELLYLRYVKYMTLEEIACSMEKQNGGHYSYDHTRRLHWKALKEFSKCHRNATLGSGNV